MEFSKIHETPLHCGQLNKKGSYLSNIQIKPFEAPSLNLATRSQNNLQSKIQPMEMQTSTCDNELRIMFSFEHHLKEDYYNEHGSANWFQELYDDCIFAIERLNQIFINENLNVRTKFVHLHFWDVFLDGHSVEGVEQLHNTYSSNQNVKNAKELSAAHVACWIFSDRYATELNGWGLPHDIVIKNDAFINHPTIFAHEIGHTAGLLHNIESGDYDYSIECPTWFSDIFGECFSTIDVDLSGFRINGYGVFGYILECDFRTIMAVQRGSSCTTPRIPRFSYQGLYYSWHLETLLHVGNQSTQANAYLSDCINSARGLFNTSTSNPNPENRYIDGFKLRGRRQAIALTARNSFEIKDFNNQSDKGLVIQAGEKIILGPDFRSGKNAVFKTLQGGCPTYLE